MFGLPIQVNTPLGAIGVLKSIIYTTVQHTHGTQALIITEPISDGRFLTSISCLAFKHRYKSAASVPSIEAEANAMYEFLRYLTNVARYSVVDHNYSTLSDLIDQVNRYDISMASLQLCVKKAAHMIRAVYSSIADMHKGLQKHPHAQYLTHVTAPVQVLLGSLQDYCAATRHIQQAFQRDKVPLTPFPIPTF